MSKKRIHSNLKRIDAMSDEDIDYSDIPELDDDFFKNAGVVVSPGKKQIALRVDTDVLGGCPRIEAVARGSHFESIFSII